jgi:hypothetical protein
MSDAIGSKMLEPLVGAGSQPGMAGLEQTPLDGSPPSLALGSVG